jgi:beta-phosphoglucomutase
MIVFLFDLDGVLVDTAQFHFLAWRATCRNLGFDLSEQQNERLKGIDRRTSLRILLDVGNKTIDEERFESELVLKNERYLKLIDQLTPDDLFPGVISLFDSLKARKIKIGLGSASKNAKLILKKLEITPYFDAIIDGTQVVNGKPDPEVFLKGAQACGAEPEQCIVFEDAAAGIEAAKKGRMGAVGIGDSRILNQADLIYQDLAAVDLEQVLTILK